MSQCPTGCGRVQQPGKLMCYPCWREVPKHLQKEVYRTNRLRMKAKIDDLDNWRSAWGNYRKARDAAIASVP